MPHRLGQLTVVYVAAPFGTGIRRVVEKVASIRLGGGTRAGRRIRVRARRGPDRDVVTPNWARSGAVRPFMQVASLELR